MTILMDRILLIFHVQELGKSLQKQRQIFWFLPANFSGIITLPAHISKAQGSNFF